MTWNLPVARLQHWMDLVGVLSVTPWAARPKFIEGVDRPQPSCICSTAAKRPINWPVDAGRSTL